MYKFALKYTKYFHLPKQTPNTQTAWLAFPLIIKDSAPFTRLELVTFLENNNIQTRPVFTGNVLKQPGFEKIPHRLSVKSFPNTELAMRNAFVVGSHHGLNSAQIKYLQECFTKFLSQF